MHIGEEHTTLEEQLLTEGDGVQESQQTINSATFY